MRLIVISGRSGSGKSAALHALEDSGLTCIDNLPASLLPSLFKRLENNSEDERSLAVSIDVRNPWSDLNNIGSILSDLKKTGVQYQVVYFDAHTDTLFKRFSESRRKHPLTDEITDLEKALSLEEKLLLPIKQISQAVVDTSALSPHELHGLLRNMLELDTRKILQLTFESFGFKYGPPADADFVFDVRCLPNPHWDTSLRELSGKDQKVIDYLCSEDMVVEMEKDLVAFVSRWLPKFESANRSYLTIAIGCTGGQHRSVYISERLKTHFAEMLENVQVNHRELSR